MSNFDPNIAEVPADDIRVGVTITNIRTHFKAEAIEELADSILTEGLMSPLVVMESEDDDSNPITELVAGERRLRAIKYIQANLDEEFMEDGIPCVQYVGTLHDASFANAIENIEREEVDDVDISAWIHSQVQNGISQTELANRVHRKLQWVNFRHLFHERACQELKDLLREGLISFSAAYELSKNVDEKEQKKRVKRARSFNEKISIEAAKNAGNPNKSSKPSKKQREAILARLEQLADEDGRASFRGAATALRWAEGLISDDEMEEFLEMDPADTGDDDG